MAGHFFKETRSSFLWTRLLNAPFWGIFTMLTLVLYKDMHATPLQITVLVAMKPLAGLLSPYWSLAVHGRSDRLVSNLVWGNIIKFIPFLVFPFLNNVWLMIAAFGVYMALSRGVTPAWMEIIKRNVEGKERERITQLGSAIDFLVGGVMPVAFSFFLDHYEFDWRWIFFWTSVLGIFSTLFLLRLPVGGKHTITTDEVQHTLAKPLQIAWKLLKARPDFARFQLGYMFGGSALIMIHSALPYFFVDVLHLNYVEMTTAANLCKGIGFALSSPLWLKLFDRWHITRVASFVILLAGLFPLVLFAATWHVALVYLAFLLYGTMQGGSELTWHMSGPVFAQHKDSSTYSSLNVLTVGLRGCFAPALGSLILTSLSAGWVMVLAAALCATGAITLQRLRKHS